MIEKIYEIQNIGKGVINNILPGNLLQITDKYVDGQGLQQVIDVNSLVGNSNITVADSTIFNIVADGNSNIIKGVIGIDAVSGNDYTSIFGSIQNSNFTGFKVMAGANLAIEDSITNKGIQYTGNYESNFTDRSLVTKLYVDSLNNSNNNIQTSIFTNYTLSNSDHNTTIIVTNNTTPITITIPNTITILGFCVGFIQEGTGDVTFNGPSIVLVNTNGTKSKGQGYQTFIERKLNTSTYFLLGNTKA
jgi:hypothetical protein